MMNTFLWFMIFPMLWPLYARYKWPYEITWREMSLNIVIVIVCCSIVFFTGRYSNCTDTQILNGQVVNKDRHHGSYLRSYPCNCRTVNKTTTCQTCTEHHYTVTWSALTTIGPIQIDHKDRTSRAVYNTPDPQRYTIIEKGEHVSKSDSYMNWIKGAPDSLFNTGEQKQSFPYPAIYDIYRYNRVTNVGAKIDVKDLNNTLNEKMKVLGPSKHANLQVFTTGGDAKNLRQIVETQWLGGKVNDVVVFLGIIDNKIVDADAFTWARSKQNELFAVQLRDNLLGSEYSPENIANKISGQIATSYIRPRMEDFEYLKDRIDPPTWVIILVVLLSIGGSIGLTIYFYNNEETS